MEIYFIELINIFLPISTVLETRYVYHPPFTVKSKLILLNSKDDSSNGFQCLDESRSLCRVLRDKDRVTR